MVVAWRREVQHTENPFCQIYVVGGALDLRLAGRNVNNVNNILAAGGRGLARPWVNTERAFF